MSKEIKVVIREPKERCSRREMLLMRARYVHMLWQMKQELELDNQKGNKSRTPET